MGQQVPYETISMLTECMVQQEAKANPFQPLPDVTVARVKIVPDAPPLARAEFSVKRKQPEEQIDVHVYEAYWASLTAGKATFRETLSFLVTAAFNGMTSRLRSITFKRWMFGGFQDLPIKPGTFIALLLALVSLLVALVPAGYFATEWKTFMAAGFSLATLFAHGWFALATLALLAVYTWVLRYVIIEYVGDVAVYVSSYKVSRFEETRNKIQETVGAVFRQVYQSTSENYDSVVVVGHSLGSLIAYDALNAMISCDKEEHQGHLRVVERTRRLITFGSPLDKIAFLFRTQVSSQRFLREALAARKQPLILDYAKFRPNRSFRWINIYSSADFVSGPLKYYDTPERDGRASPPDRHPVQNIPGVRHSLQQVPDDLGPPGGGGGGYADYRDLREYAERESGSGRNPVQNIPDYRAWIPFVAHIQYWRNPVLREQLLDAIAADVAVAPVQLT
jgi:pimeloyl-ACP methyl ester carboxylesterase